MLAERCRECMAHLPEQASRCLQCSTPVEPAAGPTGPRLPVPPLPGPPVVEDDPGLLGGVAGAVNRSMHEVQAGTRGDLGRARRNTAAALAHLRAQPLLLLPAAALAAGAARPMTAAMVMVVEVVEFFFVFGLLFALPVALLVVCALWVALTVCRAVTAAAAVAGLAGEPRPLWWALVRSARRLHTVVLWGVVCGALSLMEALAAFTQRSPGRRISVDELFRGYYGVARLLLPVTVIEGLGPISTYRRARALAGEGMRPSSSTLPLALFCACWLPFLLALGVDVAAAYAVVMVPLPVAVTLWAITDAAAYRVAVDVPAPPFDSSDFRLEAASGRR